MIRINKQMKKTICLLVFSLLALPSISQQRNKMGLKVVSKIEAYQQGKEEPYIIIDFKYNSAFELQEVIHNAPASEETIYWKKQGNTLTQKVLWHYQSIYKPPKYIYTLTPDGYIRTKTMDDLGIDGSVLRHLYEYHYDAENSKLSMIYSRTFFKEPKGQFDELSDRDRTYYGWDSKDNMFKSRIDAYNWRNGQTESNLPIEWNAFKYHDEHMNDTNLNLSLIYESLSDTNEFEMLTEWVCCHSNHLVENKYSAMFLYTFDNEQGDTRTDGDQGNIIQIDVYQHEKLDVYFKLYYIM